MMCRGSKGVVLGGVLACVGASRAKVDMKSAGAVQAVDTITSMLSLQHEEIHRIAEAVDAEATPGAADLYTTSLKKVLDKIKADLKPKVTEAQDTAQDNIDAALTAVQEAERGAVTAKGVADKQDKAWVACVSQELQMKTFEEKTQERLAEAKQDEQEARELEQRSSAFTFETGDQYEMVMKCDNDVEGGCMQAKTVLMRSMKKMLQDAETAMKAKQNYYNDAAEDLSEKEKETVDAEQTLETAGENHASHRNKCQASKLRRDKAICEYGDTLQAKGVQEEDFKKVIASVGAQEAEICEPWAVPYEGACYGVIDQSPFDDSDLKCQSSAHALPTGYMLATYSASVQQEVVRKHSFGTVRVVYANGDTYETGAVQCDRCNCNNCNIANNLEIDAETYTVSSCSGWAKVFVVRYLPEAAGKVEVAVGEGTIVAPFVYVPQSAYAELPEGTQKTAARGSVAFSLHCSQTTTVKFKAWILAPNSGADSFRIQTEDGVKRDWHTGGGPKWEWSTDSPASSISEGAGKVTLWGREDGIKFKSLKLVEGAESCHFSQGEMSESDRKQEWKTLSHTECMLERGIEKGLEGSIDAEDHRACSEEPELEDLDRKTAEIGQMRESHANEAGPITFGGGEGWKVSSNGETAADYSKEDFKPTLNPNALQQPFAMCPQANMDSWKAVVADQLEAASTVPSAWARLLRMWGQ